MLQIMTKLFCRAFIINYTHCKDSFDLHKQAVLSDINAQQIDMINPKKLSTPGLTPSRTAIFEEIQNSSETSLNEI